MMFKMCHTQMNFIICIFDRKPIRTKLKEKIYESGINKVDKQKYEKYDKL